MDMNVFIDLILAMIHHRQSVVLLRSTTALALCGYVKLSLCLQIFLDYGFF